MAEKEREPIGWFTSNGAKIPIYDGQTRDEAFKEFQIKANKAEADERNNKKDSLSFLNDNPKLSQAVEKAFHKANLMNEPDIYKALYSYKIIRELKDEKIEALYDWLANRLFGANW